MKKMVSHLVVVCMFAFIVIGCSSTNKTIAVSHSVNSVPFALSLKGKLDEHTVELSKKIIEYMKQKKYYFVKIGNAKKLREIVNKNNLDNKWYYKDFVKSRLSSLNNDFFKSNNLIIVITMGDISTFIKIDEIKKNKNVLTVYQIPNASPGDAALGLDCYVIGVSSNYAKDITEVKLEYTGKYMP